MNSANVPFNQATAAKRGLHAIMLFVCLLVCSFVCPLSRNGSPAADKGVPCVSSLLKNFPSEIYGCDRGLLVKVKVWIPVLAIAQLTLVTSSALQSRKWQLIGMSQ